MATFLNNNQYNQNRPHFDLDAFVFGMLEDMCANSTNLDLLNKTTVAGVYKYAKLNELSTTGKDILLTFAFSQENPLNRLEYRDRKTRSLNWNSVYRIYITTAHKPNGNSQKRLQDILQYIEKTLGNNPFIYTATVPGTTRSYSCNLEKNRILNSVIIPEGDNAGRPTYETLTFEVELNIFQ